MLTLLIAAIISGLLLAAAHRWRRTTFLFAVAWLPMLTAMVVTSPGIGRGVLAGTVLGAAYVVPLAIHLRFPPLLALGLAGYLLSGFALAGTGIAAAVAHLSPLIAALAVTAIVAICDRLTVHVAPAWGTAQSWIRPLSRWSWCARSIGRFGQTPALVAVVLPQALVAMSVGPWLVGRPFDPTGLLAAVGVCALIAVLAFAVCPRTITVLRVAAIGWDWNRLLVSGLIGQPVDEAALLMQPIARAAAGGARLVVTPETGLNLTRANRARWIERLSAQADEHDLTLVVGWLDEASRENRAGIFQPRRGLVAEYAKTHLVIAAGEHLMCNRGRGETVQVDVDGIRVGVLICHDDNFAAPARRHARAGTRLLAIPTNDWKAVKYAHLENVPWRAVENRLAIVRGASGGISAAIAPDGRIVDRMDHTQDGHGVIICDVPVC